MALPGRAFGAAYEAPAYAVDAPPVDAQVRRMDLDGNGSKESEVTFQNRRITLVRMYKHLAKIPYAVIYYKNGCRDRAEIDTNGDKRPDVWIKYYFTGLPASIACDRNGDGQAEMWKYFKNGFIYKREWDRNHDGKPDYRILFDVKPDFRPTGKTEEQAIEKQYDNDFDGKFEKDVKTSKKARPKRVGLLPGSFEEISAE